MPMKVMSALAASASVSLTIGWRSSISRSSGDEAMTGSGIGNERALTLSAMVKMTL